jgi:hypothetical protein
MRIDRWDGDKKSLSSISVSFVVRVLPFGCQFKVCSSVDVSELVNPLSGPKRSTFWRSSKMQLFWISQLNIYYVCVCEVDRFGTGIYCVLPKSFHVPIGRYLFGCRYRESSTNKQSNTTGRMYCEAILWNHMSSCANLFNWKYTERFTKMFT